MTRQLMPSVSVVIASFNHEQYLTKSLESVASQTVLPEQLIITDDGSADESVEQIRAWVDQNWPEAECLISNVNRGLPATLNKVVPSLQGDFAIVMSADDLMVPNRIELQLQAFAEGGAGVGMVYSDMTEIDEFGQPTGQRWFDLDRMGPAPGSGDLFGVMIRRACMAAPTVMVRRQLLQSVGPYDESLVAEDYDMFLRLSRRATWMYIEEPLVNYRVLDSSLSRSSTFLEHRRNGRIKLLRKHVGASPQTDLIIADRTAQMATSLYLDGRPARLTAVDLRFALSIRRSTRDAVFLLTSRLRVPGAAVARMIAATHRIRTRIRRSHDHL